MKNLFKRSLAVALALVMCVSMMNLTAFASWPFSCNHSYQYDNARADGSKCMRTCTKCGDEIECEHSDYYCQWHGGYDDKQHTGGDGYCDYCHAQVGNPNCPGPSETTCDHIGKGRREVTVREATCTQPKLVDKYCTHCEEKVAQNEVVGVALGHEWGTTWTHTDSASCDHAQAGTHSMTCSRCHGEETGGTKSENHTYGAGEMQANGATRYTCTACGHWYEEGCNHTNATGGDTYVFNRQVTQGNCTTEGSAIYKCSRCGHEVTRSTGLVADAHNYVKTDNTTIRQDGASGHYWVCTRNASHTHTATEAHHYSAWNWVYTNWVDDTDDARIQHREANGTRTCDDCGYQETANVKHTDTDKKGLTDEDLTRQKGEKTFDVAYLVLNGGTSTAPLAQTTVHLLEDDDPVAVELKPFTGYTFDHTDRQTISYTDDAQRVVHVYYTRNNYTLTVEYTGLPEGQEIESVVTPNVPYDSPIGVGEIPEVRGYTGAARSDNATKMPAANTTIYVDYTALGTHAVRWLNWNGTVLQTGSFFEGETAPVAGAFTGNNPTRASDGTYTYAFRGWSAPAVDADGNVTYTAQFTPTLIYYPPVTSEPVVTPTPSPEPSEEVEVTEPPTPLDPLPELPEEPVIDVEDPETPLDPLPELPEEPVEVEVEDPDVPLANVPQTGDNTVLWATTAVVSGAGLIWLAVDGKKRREDAE